MGCSHLDSLIYSAFQLIAGKNTPFLIKRRTIGLHRLPKSIFTKSHVLFTYLICNQI